MTEFQLHVISIIFSLLIHVHVGTHYIYRINSGTEYQGDKIDHSAKKLAKNYDLQRVLLENYFVKCIFYPKLAHFNEIMNLKNST